MSPEPVYDDGGMTDPRIGFVKQLTDGDLRVLSVATGGTPEELRARLLAEPAEVDRLLADERVVAALFAGEFDAAISPWLVFGVAVHHAAADLQDASFVTERVVGAGRLPVFDVGPLRELVSTVERRMYLVGLLVSFTRIAGGVRWVRTPRGMRRRRWSELDPFHLAELVDEVAAWQRPALLRRMGDVALFLVGAYPQATSSLKVEPQRLVRLARSAGLDPGGAYELTLGSEGMVGLLEVAGARWYREAAAAGVFVSVLEEFAERFPTARRFLGQLTDRYLHRIDTDWLPRPA